MPLTEKQSQRRLEKFICQHCGAFNSGNVYMNHCPHCLWSRHVHTYPDDWQESCLGTMEPVLLEGVSPHYRILHRCTQCGFERVNGVQPEDSTDAIVKLAKNPHPPLGKEIDPETGRQFDPLWEEKSYVYPEADIGFKQSNINPKTK